MKEVKFYPGYSGNKVDNNFFIQTISPYVKQALPSMLAVSCLAINDFDKNSKLLSDPSYSSTLAINGSIPNKM